MSDDIEIGIATGDDDLTEVASVASRTGRWPSSLRDLEHLRATLADPLHLIARLGGEPIGFAYAGVWRGTENDGMVQGDVAVLPEHRRRGVGSALLAGVSKQAVALGKRALQFEVMEDDPASLSFLQRRGYREAERQMQVALELSKVETADLPADPGGIAIVTRAERPDLLKEMHEVGEEASRDVPGLDGQQEWSFDDWRAWEIDRPNNLPELCFIALDGDRVAGYALLQVFGNEVHHGFTAVGREWRRRGVGRALTARQIAAAKALGFERLSCESEERNVPMRRLTESFGYAPLPASIVMQGPPVFEPRPA